MKNIITFKPLKKKKHHRIDVRTAFKPDFTDDEEDQIVAFERVLNTNDFIPELSEPKQNISSRLTKTLQVQTVKKMFHIKKKRAYKFCVLGDVQSGVINC